MRRNDKSKYLCNRILNKYSSKLYSLVLSLFEDEQFMIKLGNTINKERYSKYPKSDYSVNTNWNKENHENSSNIITSFVSYIINGQQKLGLLSLFIMSHNKFENNRDVNRSTSWKL